MVGGKTNSPRRRGRKSVKKKNRKNTNVLSWERIGIYRVSNSGLKKKKKRDRLGESVGKVSE